MRNLIAVPAIAAVMLAASCLAPARAGVSVSINVGIPVGYSTGEDDIDMNNDELIVLNNDRVGFWIMLPNGRWAFKYRPMWFHRDYDEWYYGPWAIDYSMPYDPFWSSRCVRFQVYMNRHYPVYYGRFFRDDHWWYRGRVERCEPRNEGWRNNEHPAYRHEEPRPVQRHDNWSDRRDYKRENSCAPVQTRNECPKPTVSAKKAEPRNERPAISNRPESPRSMGPQRVDRPARTDGGMRRR